MKDFFDNRYFQTTKKMLWYLGLWPYQTLQQKLFYRTFTATIFLSVFITQVHPSSTHEMNILVMFQELSK